MNLDWVVQLLLAVVFIWLVVISFFVRKEYSYLKDFFPKSGERDIRKKFEELIDSIKGFKGDIDKMNFRVSSLENDSLKHIQKVELLRYNPYQDTGGDQSFSVALLDNGGNGIVITSLHTRSGTRVFAKPIVKGKPVKYELSDEENQVIKKALSKNE